MDFMSSIYNTDPTSPTGYRLTPYVDASCVLGSLDAFVQFPHRIAEILESNFLDLSGNLDAPL